MAGQTRTPICGVVLALPQHSCSYFCVLYHLLMCLPTNLCPSRWQGMSPLEQCRMSVYWSPWVVDGPSICRWALEENSARAMAAGPAEGSDAGHLVSLAP